MNGTLSESVIGCAIRVSRTLGHGFLERVYESALALEFRESGIAYERQMPLIVRYREHIVGEYVCDFIIHSKLLVELKALTTLTSEHEAQIMNYLKSSGISAGLLLNFGSSKLGIKRIVLGHNDAAPI